MPFVAIVFRCPYIEGDRANSGLINGQFWATFDHFIDKYKKIYSNYLGHNSLNFFFYKKRTNWFFSPINLDFFWRKKTNSNLVQIWLFLFQKKKCFCFSSEKIQNYRGKNSISFFRKKSLEGKKQVNFFFFFKFVFFHMYGPNIVFFVAGLLKNLKPKIASFTKLQICMTSFSYKFAFSWNLQLLLFWL